MKLRNVLFVFIVLVLFIGFGVEEVQAGFFKDVSNRLNRGIIDIINRIAGHVVAKPPHTHFACLGGNCVLVNGDSTDKCLDDSYCTENVETCDDGTIFGNCVIGHTPKYCSGEITGGEIIDRCSVCGCEQGMICGDDEKCTNETEDNNENGDGYDNTEDGEGGVCDEGETRDCGSDIGECVFGVQTCVNRVWGDCVGGISAVMEVCDDGLDNDCDGEIDEGCNVGNGEVNAEGNEGNKDGGGNGGKGNENNKEDSDGDGLLDKWEMQYFGNLNYGWYDDPDGDGIINADEFEQSRNPAVSDKKKNGIFIVMGSVLGVLILIIVLLVVISNGRKRRKRKKILLSGVSEEEGSRVKEKEKVKEKGAEEKRKKNILIREYIKKARERGFNDKQIMDSLIRVGWKRRDIDWLF